MPIELETSYIHSSCEVVDTITTCDYSGVVFYVLIFFFFIWLFEFIYSFISHLWHQFS